MGTPAWKLTGCFEVKQTNSGSETSAACVIAEDTVISWTCLYTGKVCSGDKPPGIILPILESCPELIQIFLLVNLSASDERSHLKKKCEWDIMCVHRLYVCVHAASYEQVLEEGTSAGQTTSPSHEPPFLLDDILRFCEE